MPNMKFLQPLWTAMVLVVCDILSCIQLSLRPPPINAATAADD